MEFGNENLKIANSNLKIENCKLKTESWKLKIENWKLKLCVGIPSSCGLPLWPPIVGGHSGNTVELWPPGNTVQLWPPTVASHCGLPLWEAMGIPLKIAFDKFPYVFLPEAMGGHSGRPWEYHSKLLLINFSMFSYRRPREATGIPLERNILI